MKKYLKQLLKEQQLLLKRAKSKNEIDNIQKNISEILFYLSDNHEQKKELSRKKIESLSSSEISNKLYQFINDIISLYKENPLLETECSTKYPSLDYINFKSYDNLINFWNNLYYSEVPSLNKEVFNNFNTIFFEKSIFKKLFLERGKSILYNDFLTSEKTILIEKHYNIRDFIDPCSTSLPLILNNENDIVKNCIAMAFIREKAIQALKKGSYNSEANKIQLIQLDSLIYNSRYLDRYINAIYDNSKIKGQILNFIYTIIGMELANIKSFNLDILNNNDINSTIENNLEEITENTKILCQHYKLKK